MTHIFHLQKVTLTLHWVQVDYARPKSIQKTKWRFRINTSSVAPKPKLCRCKDRQQYTLDQQAHCRHDTLQVCCKHSSTHLANKPLNNNTQKVEKAFQCELFSTKEPDDTLTVMSIAPKHKIGFKTNTNWYMITEYGQHSVRSLQIAKSRHKHHKWSLT